MPQVPIAELFRSFPSPKGWGGHYLEPDLAAYGVLKDANAALFVEYDGYWRHGEKEGMERDRIKNAALLKYAPEGSYVVRISHTISLPLQDKNVLWVSAQTWRSGSPGLVSRVHADIIEQTVTGLKHKLCPQVVQRLQLQTQSCKQVPSTNVVDFLQGARTGKAGNTMDEISQFLVSAGFSAIELDMMLEKVLVPGMSIEQTLRPKLQCLLDLGLTKRQVAKAVASYPPSSWPEHRAEPEANSAVDRRLGPGQDSSCEGSGQSSSNSGPEHRAEPEANSAVDRRLGPDQDSSCESSG